MKVSKIFKFREGEQGEAVKPFLDHLEDLRWVIIKMAVALAHRHAFGVLLPHATGSHPASSAQVDR